MRKQQEAKAASPCLLWLQTEKRTGVHMEGTNTPITRVMQSPCVAPQQICRWSLCVCLSQGAGALIQSINHQQSTTLEEQCFL